MLPGTNLGAMAQNAATGYAAMQPQGVDPSLAAYGQTEMGKLVASPQSTWDASAAAYGPSMAGGFGPAMGMLGSFAQSQQPTEQQMAPPPMPQLPDVYGRNRRRQF
jgi:hypothetical protein